ncbi:hypothetical protein RHSIM_Rhsim01G0232800 [Rhododendron simsii]|uniref:Uncharacterized protein n=1 Tax=Rhododendron simsii TaxID=118357 RepID=A0A834LWV6_RHOSS|nr:hypothetical protein RHSIM_Rhsim01G0232800 [Rhododendron simsii]
MVEAMSSEQSAQNELVGGLAISQLVGEEDHDRDRGGAQETGLKRRLWVETKKLWHLVGPTILSRICTATFAVVTQAFAGHLGDVELASISIVNTVILGFCFGLVIILEYRENLGRDDNTVDFVRVAPNPRDLRIRRTSSSLRQPRVLSGDLVSSPSSDRSRWKTANITVLENWYYRILVLMTGNLKNSTLALDALLVCMNVNAWEMMIPISFCAAIGVRVANELGAGNGKGAKFATKVSVGQSLSIGILFSLLIIIFNHKLAMIFSSSHDVIQAVGKLSYLLALTILFNSVQPVLSGVAVGSGWQSWVAYINIGCYYLIGIPVGLLLGRVFNFGVKAQKAVLWVKHLSSPNPDDDHLMVEN